MNTIIRTENTISIVYSRVAPSNPEDLHCYIEELPEIPAGKKLWLRANPSTSSGTVGAGSGTGNAEVILIDITAEEILTKAKQAKTAAISAYDQSTSVNSFKLNGHAIWLSRDIRSDFRTSLKAYKESNLTEIELTLPDLNLDKTIPVELGFALLNQLDVYSAKCNIQTKRHLMAVNALTTPEAVNAYDHTANYPEKLTFNI